MGMLQRVFTVTSPSKTVSLADTLYALLQAGISSGVIYIILGQISTWATSGHLTASTAAIVSAVIIGLTAGLRAYFGGPTPTPVISPVAPVTSSAPVASYPTQH